jgi:hypothetical protein
VRSQRLSSRQTDDFGFGARIGNPDGTDLGRWSQFGHAQSDRGTFRHPVPLSDQDVVSAYLLSELLQEAFSQRRRPRLDGLDGTQVLFGDRRMRRQKEEKRRNDEYKSGFVLDQRFDVLFRGEFRKGHDVGTVLEGQVQDGVEAVDVEERQYGQYCVSSPV